MEKAGTEDMPENAEHKGIGTPATRAGIIEKLVRIGFVERKGDKKTKYLIPTHKGGAQVLMRPAATNVGKCPCCHSDVDVILLRRCNTRKLHINTQIKSIHPFSVCTMS